jgi:hypothetical protein
VLAQRRASTQLGRIAHIAHIVAESEQTGFYCVGEAAPAKGLKALAEALPRRGMQISF